MSAAQRAEPGTAGSVAEFRNLANIWRGLAVVVPPGRDRLRLLRLADNAEIYAARGVPSPAAGQVAQ